MQLTQQHLDAMAQGRTERAIVKSYLESLEKLKEQEKPMTQDLENDFVRVAKSFSERKGISYKAWREVGVPARVLKLAGIHR